MPLRDIDSKLIDRCLGKEPGAWNDFVDRYMGLIYHVIQHVAYARSRLLTTEDVEDIAAEIFLKIVDNDYAVLKKFKGLSSLPTYLTVIARRICVKELIKRHREARARSHERPPGVRRRWSVRRGRGDRLGRGSRQDARGPDRARGGSRSPLSLKFMNYRDIAKQLGMPENSVGPILARARKKLREAAEHSNSA